MSKQILSQIYFGGFFSNYSQLLSDPWGNCDQLTVKLPRDISGNTQPIYV